MRSGRASRRRWYLNSDLCFKRYSRLEGGDEKEGIPGHGVLRGHSLGAGHLGCGRAPPRSGLSLLRGAVASELSSGGALPRALPLTSLQKCSMGSVWAHVSLGVERLPAEETHSAGPADGDGVHRHGECPPPRPYTAPSCPHLRPLRTGVGMSGGGPGWGQCPWLRDPSGFG